MNLKKIVVYICGLAILGTGMITGCKKHTTHPSSVCKITGISSSKSGPLTITYTADGKIQSTRKGTSKKVFTYNAATKVESVWYNGDLYFTATSQLDGNDKIIKTTVNYQSVHTGEWLKVNYDYSGDKVTKIHTLDDKGKSDVISFQWSNGNITSMADNGQTSKYAYQTGKSNSQGDYFNYEARSDYLRKAVQIYAPSSVVFLSNKNLVKSVTYSYGSTSDISYIFDKKGKIKSMTISPSSGTPETISYQYKCK